jgi:hypothetical protein
MINDWGRAVLGRSLYVVDGLPEHMADASSPSLDDGVGTDWRKSPTLCAYSDAIGSMGKNLSLIHI